MSSSKASVAARHETVHPAATAFHRVLVPDVPPAVGVVASLGACAVGFAARPLGGLLAGTARTSRVPDREVVAA